ncbi:MAG: bifunctional DNA-formamidopyrimidine glycosylase/DNA-(apurinic or apyrimidinic site) lyase [Candidatus Pacebacteria bacterium]|nr:bifunctional DNA-formamidopyrimidine glycosylase/DNA-(apurinic or apyrimidinic site) lyase [Candidatus Paceibacterota bacterium]MBP9818427.1 bifunctional DNA-formamidopyrimidine glycosylase/DNA-(apurinic or apyrimidinic site) lyase [Candidatus Paceibacterota bacterium]
MPELPEVQTTVDGINKTVRGLQIVDVWTNYNSPAYADKNEIKNSLFFAKFKKIVVGVKIKKASRKAKNILIELSNGYTILIHMKMTGHIMYGKYVFDPKGKSTGIRTGTEKDPWVSESIEGPLADPFNRHIRLVFTLEDAKGQNKHLVLSDMRKFAKVTVLKTDEIHASSHLDTVGPDSLAADFTYSLFESRLLIRPTGKIKTVLMDQTVIAGVGNIYSDEALWRASIHPEHPTKDIPKSLLKKLHTSVIEVLKQGIDFGGDSMSDYRNIHGERGEFQLKHQAYRRTGKLCEKKGCKGIIQRKVVGGRSAHFCSVHQVYEGS